MAKADHTMRLWKQKHVEPPSDRPECHSRAQAKEQKLPYQSHLLAFPDKANHTLSRWKSRYITNGECDYWFIDYLVFGPVEIGGHGMGHYQIVGSDVELDLGVSSRAVSAIRGTAMEWWVFAHEVAIHYEHVGLVECGPVLHSVPKLLEANLSKVDIILPWKITEFHLSPYGK